MQGFIEKILLLWYYILYVRSDTMMDLFIEQVVKKKRTVKDTLIFIITILMVILIPTVLAVGALLKFISAYFLMIAFFLFVIGVWVIWYVRVNQNVEFEYQMVQDTLVVSKIIDKRRRKTMVKIDVKNFDVMDKAENEEVAGMNFMKVYEACGDFNDKSNNYYAVYQHSSFGKTALVFTPNEKVLNAMKPYLKKDIALKLFYKR